MSARPGKSQARTKAHVRPLKVAPPSPDSALVTALKNNVGKLLEYYQQEAKTNRPAIQKRIDSGEINVLELVKAELVGSLPPAMVVAGPLKPEMEKALGRLAMESIKDAGGPFEALMGLGQSNVQDLIGRIRG